MEEKVEIPGPGVTLEGRLSVGPAPGGAVITHPHPLFGGDMANNVVLTAVRGPHGPPPVRPPFQLPGGGAQHRDLRRRPRRSR